MCAFRSQEESDPRTAVFYLLAQCIFNLSYCSVSRQIFNTLHTLGGRVTNINGHQIRGDYIAQINNAFYFTSSSSLELGHILEHLRGTGTTHKVPLPVGVSQSTQDYLSARTSFTNQVETNVAIIDTSHISANRALIEIQVIVRIMDTLIENTTLHHSETLPNTLASLQRMLTLAELAVQAYKHTPLAETLSYYMTLQVDHCRPLDSYRS